MAETNANAKVKFSEMKKRYWIVIALLFLVQPTFYVDRELEINMSPGSSNDGFCRFEQSDDTMVGILLINYLGPGEEYVVACGYRVYGNQNLRGRFSKFELTDSEGNITNLLPPHREKLEDMKVSHQSKTGANNTEEAYSYIFVRERDGRSLENFDTIKVIGETCDTSDNCTEFRFDGHLEEKKSFGIASRTWWRLMSV